MQKLLHAMLLLPVWRKMSQLRLRRPTLSRAQLLAPLDPMFQAVFPPMKGQRGRLVMPLNALMYQVETVRRPDF